MSPGCEHEEGCKSPAALTEVAILKLKLGKSDRKQKKITTNKKQWCKETAARGCEKSTDHHQDDTTVFKNTTYNKRQQDSAEA